MKVTKIDSTAVQKPAYGFQLDLTAAGFWRLYPYRIMYGIQTNPGLTASAPDGSKLPVYGLAEWDTRENPIALYLTFDLVQTSQTHGASKAPVHVLIAAGEKKLLQEVFSVKFQDGLGFLGLDGLPLSSSMTSLRAELSMDKSLLFTVEIPIVRGLPTADAGVKPGPRPVFEKRFERDAKGRISKIIEGNGVVRLIERDASGKMIAILEQ